jgi:hypothetical protein
MEAHTKRDDAPVLQFPYEGFRVVTSESNAFIRAMTAEDGAKETEVACLNKMPKVRVVNVQAAEYGES